VEEVGVSGVAGIAAASVMGDSLKNDWKLKVTSRQIEGKKKAP
jgi:hypothetical protein